MNNLYPNPYMQSTLLNPYPAVYAPAMQVVKVNGRNGAEAYQIGANSSALLLDESGLLVWLVTTDGAGYKTVTAYDIKPHEEAPAPDFASLEARIKRLEDAIHADTGDTAAAGAN